MQLKIRQRKKENKQQHPDYLIGKERTWVDNERERTQDSFRRNFVAILAVIAVVAIILIVSAVGAVSNLTQEQQITAADTFSVTQYEQQQMQETATRFAKDILIYAYCSDQETAFECKNDALSVMANNTESYDEVMKLRQVNPVIAKENLLPVVTTPEIQETTRAIASNVTYIFSAVAADESNTTMSEDGSFIDQGYDISTTFSYVKDERTNEYAWVISECSIRAKE